MDSKEITAKSLKRKNPPQNPAKAQNSSNDDDDSDNDVIYIEDSSESEPELDCDIWDEDCKVVDTVKPACGLGGFHLMPTCDKYPSKKPKLSPPELNEHLIGDVFTRDFKTGWSKGEKVALQDTELIVDPFRVCVLQNFLQNPRILDDLRQEFNEIDWNVRSMDLYEFCQSEDLKKLTSFPVVTQFYEFLQKDVLKWVSNLTGYDLTSISATCSYYSNTDHLLVHDDQRGDRRVAFVLYFTGLNCEWSRDKGGALQLLNRDENGQPKETVRDIYPSHNQFVFFPVTNESYHQVAEVTSLSDCRFSINGWFHSDNPPVFESPKYEPHPATSLLNESKSYIEGQTVDLDLEIWISREYLMLNDVDLQIQEYFEENSEISLKGFLNEGCLKEITEVLQNNELEWIKIGPPNRFNYEILKDDNLPESLDRFLKLFRSEQFFDLLHNYTDLDLHQNGAGMKFELQKWTPGCYTLLSDYDWSETKELDLTFYLCCPKSSDVIGARTQYVAIDEEIQSALITLEPEENCLNLVYRDTARFTKFFSSQSRCRCFYKLVCSYRE